MRLKTILLGLAGAGLMASAPAQAVDLVGAYQDALDFDPVLQAAEFRREATQENRKIARANLLPQLGASGSWNWGTNETSVPGLELSDEDIETNTYSIDLRQSLYRQANYEALDVARGQISQADALQSIFNEDGSRVMTVGVEVEDGILIDRLSSRWSCPACGQMFNAKLDPSKVNGKCDACGDDLIQRKDDTKEVIAERLQVYHKATLPLIQYYREKNLYFGVDGNQPIDTILETIMNRIKGDA